MIGHSLDPRPASQCRAGPGHAAKVGTVPPKAVITNWVHPEAVELLEEHCAVAANQTRVPWTRDEVLAQAEGAAALMTFMPDSADESFLDRCPELRIIACALKGADNFDAAACERRGVWLTVVPDLLTAPTAELAVGLLIAMARRVPEGDRFVRSGDFAGWRPLLYGAGLDGAMVGLIGAGSVGVAIAERLRGFGCTLLYHDVTPMKAEREQALGLRRASFQDLAAQCDFLISACPLTEQSMHLIDAAFLDRVKPGCFLINIGRGSVVDEEAVADALERDRLAGYAADVFEMEDWTRPVRPESIPKRLLRNTGKTLFTPHLGSAVDRVRREIGLEAARSIVQCLEGKVPGGAINRPTSDEGRS